MRQTYMSISKEEIEKIQSRLRACPHCGPMPAMPELVKSDISHRWQVCCGPCGSSSGSAKHPQQAADSWNSRYVECAEIPTSPAALIGLAIYLNNRLKDLSMSEDLPRIGFSSPERKDEAFALAQDVTRLINSKLVFRR